MPGPETCSPRSPQRADSSAEFRPEFQLHRAQTKQRFARSHCSASGPPGPCFSTLCLLCALLVSRSPSLEVDVAGQLIEALQAHGARWLALTALGRARAISRQPHRPTTSLVLECDQTTASLSATAAACAAHHCSLAEVTAPPSTIHAFRFCAANNAMNLLLRAPLAPRVAEP